MAKEYPLSLIIRAVDRATAPLRAINQRLQKITAPVRKLNNSFRALADEAGLPRLVKGFSGVGKAVVGVGREALELGAKLGALAAGATFAFYRIVRGAVDAGDKLAEMAQRVGLSVDAYAQLQFAAQQADVEAEAFGSAMDQLNKRLGEAKAGSGALLAFLEKVSPSLARQVKGAKTTEEALALLTGAFEKVKDPARRAALAAAAFGKSGLQMGQFLGQGTAAIEEQRRRFLELSGSQEEFARGAGDLDNAIRETEMSFLGLRTAAAGALFPALTELARALTGLLAGNRGRIAQWAREVGAALSSWLAGGGLERLVTTMRRWADTIATVVDKLGGLKGVATILGVYLGGGFLASVATAVGSLWQLGSAVLPMVLRAVALLIPVIGKLTLGLFALNLANPLFWIAAVGAALAAAAYVIWKNWEPIKKFFEDLWGTIKEILASPLGALKTAGEFWGKKLFGDGGSPALGAQLGAGAALPGAGGVQTQAAHVTVDFTNMPKGTRVTPDPRSTAPLDLGLGYSMAASH